MRRHSFSLLAAMTLASAVTFAQQTPTPASPASPEPQGPASPAPARPQMPGGAATVQTPAGSDVTLTGCLVQGSSPTVFVIENAKTGTASPSDKGKSYVLTVAPSATVDLRSQLNHQVRIVGLSDDKSAVIVTPPAAGAPSATTTVVKVEEKDMPKFTTRTISRISDTCVTS